MHQRRRPAPQDAPRQLDCSGRFASLEFRCQYSDALQAAAARGVVMPALFAVDSSSEAAGDGSLPPQFGIDPAALEGSDLHYPPLAYSMGGLLRKAERAAAC